MNRGNTDSENTEASSHLLTAQQEKELARIVATGGEAAERARTQFIEANQGLIYTIARRYQGYGLDLEDLVQVGNIGLMRAIDKFDVARGKPTQVMLDSGGQHLPEYNGRGGLTYVEAMQMDGVGSRVHQRLLLPNHRGTLCL